MNNKEIKDTSSIGFRMPDFHELEKLASEYEALVDVGFVYCQSKRRQGGSYNDYIVREIKTGKEIKEEPLKSKAIFANMWFAACPQYGEDDFREGSYEEFLEVEDIMEMIYIYTMEQLLYDADRYGEINIVNALVNGMQPVNSIKKEKYYDQLLSRLFSTKEGCSFINRLITASLGKEKNAEIEPARGYSSIVEDLKNIRQMKEDNVSKSR